MRLDVTPDRGTPPEVPLLVLSLLAGCGCGVDAPTWSALPDLYLGGQAQVINLSPFALDDGELTFAVDYPDGVVAEIDSAMLTVTPEPGFVGEVLLWVTATDACGTTRGVELLVLAEEPPPTTTTAPTGPCTTTFQYRPVGTPDAVHVAGSFNDWDPDAQPMVAQADGTYAVDLPLAPGPYTYKFIEIDRNAFDDTYGWTCDPAAELISCDPGYKEPWATDWSHQCAPNANSCNSLILVEDCALPTLDVASVDTRDGRLKVRVDASAGASPIVGGEATLDGAPLDVAFDGAGWSVDVDAPPGRHTLRFTAIDERGRRSTEAYIPAWTDDVDDDAGVLYFAFIDRLFDGDPANNGSEGATAVGGDFEGGDVRGLIEMLPYLDDLGVTVLWLSNLQGNASGGWSGDCGQTYAGYHAYWPDQAREPEEHFGDPATIEELVDEAHARGMRVIMDWVANHVHEDHPYAIDHPEWFNADGICNESVGGQANWDRIPETCAFAPYIPDLDYSQPEVMTTMLDDALWWATTYELDGFRVDAVKHMPHAVPYNLATLVEQRLEHRAAGGTNDFYTIGETFDSYARIKAYIGPEQLDGQFDFDLYYGIRSAFMSGDSELANVYFAWNTSRDVYGDAPMSTFLGNHDVLRFVSQGAEGFVGACQDGQIQPAPPASSDWPYESLRLAWAFLMTMPGRPLIYYGDEIGMPGRGDPDNRQPLSWHVDPDGVQSVDDMAARLPDQQAQTVRAVRALARARADHPALYRGGWTEWWREFDVFAVAREADGDHALVVLNRSSSDRTLDNGLSFAGLPQGRYVDALTGDVVQSSGDRLVFTVPARAARVWILEP